MMDKTAVSALLDRELSTRSRVGHVLLLLAASTMSAVIGSLWATEPTLPARTVTGFAVLTTMGVCWMAYAAWVLTSRRVLLGRQRVVAARMAALFSAVALAGALVVGLLTGMPAAWPAALVFASMLAIAIVLLVRCERHYAQLCRRRAELAQGLASQALMQRTAPD
jgi:MFS family permease